MACNTIKRCHRNNVHRPPSTEQISGAAAEIIGSNDDLVVEILQSLPSKSLIRFRSVSKAWLSLISSHRFSVLLWRRHPKISGLFLTSKSRCRTEFIKYIPLIDSDLEENKSIARFPNMNTSTCTTIIEHSCNGFLLLCCLTNLQQNPYNSARSYHVYNPTTNKKSTLPWPFSRTSTLPADHLFLVFDPLKSLHYKVVLLKRALHNNSCLCRIHIYSSETRAWCSLPDHPPFSAALSVNFSNGVYCNGSIHWISFSPQYTSTYFDVDQERFCPMPSPPCEAVTFKFWHFGESGGHLHLIGCYDGTGFNVNVSEMERDYSKWSLKYRVDLNAMMVDLASKEKMVVCDDAVSLLSLIHGDDEGDVFLVLFVGTNIIISYHIKDNSFKILDVVSSWNDLLWFKHYHVHPYIETLFPV